MPRRSASSVFQRLGQRVRAYSWRRVGILAAVSLTLSLALVLYLFGVSDHFFGRLFSAFLVWFWLLAATFLGIVPFVTWAAGSWFGKGWRADSDALGPASPAAKTAGPRAAPAARTSISHPPTLS